MTTYQTTQRILAAAEIAGRERMLFPIHQNYTEAGSIIEPKPRSPGSYRETSKAAATVGKSNAANDNRKIWGWVCDRGERGATREEISLGLGIKIQTVCFRVSDLLKATKLLETKRKRATVSGAAAFVLVGVK